MLLTWVLSALVCVTTVTSPVPDRSGKNVPLYRVPGPAFEIPCKLTDRTPDLVAVQLWVSADGGGVWQLSSEIAPDETKFEFHAKKPGEYLFAPRLKLKDGSVTPPLRDLTPAQRVVVEAGYQPVTPARAVLLGKVADELDEELTRLEFELIRKEIKQLAETKGFTNETADKIDRMRSRLREARQRLQDRDRATTDLPPSPVVVPEVPRVRSYRDENLIPPPGRPVPVTPAPREVP